MKAWGVLWWCLIGSALCTSAQDRRTVPAGTARPVLPLSFNFNRRFQQPYVDSVITATRRLLRQVELQPRSAGNDTLRLELLVHLSNAYRYTPTPRIDSVRTVARQVVQLGKDWNNIRFQVRGLLLEEYFDYTIRADYPQALRTNYQALRLTETDPQLADRYGWRIGRNLGRLNYRMGKYRESVNLFRTALNKLNRDGRSATNPLERADMLQLISESYKQNGQLDSAAHCSEEALQLVLKNNPRNTTSLAYLHNDLGVIYRIQSRYGEALKQFQQAETNWQKLGGRSGLAVTWGAMARTFYLLGQPDSALDYARKALANDANIPSTQILLYETLADASAAKNDWRAAYQYHQRFKALVDSSRTRQKVTETMTLEANFDREKLVLSQQQAQLLEQQRYLTLQREKELQDQQFITLAKDAELQKLQATAEGQRLVQLAQKTELQRRLETQALKAEAQTRQNQIRALQLTDLQTKLRLQENTRLFGVALAGLVGLSLLLYNRLLRRKNRALQQRNDELQAARHHGQTQEMVALRAQMNPHFLFNCINSIKLYTLQNDTDKASDYLTKFARLIRLVLENSRADRVSLRNELDSLHLYCELEAMRFKQKVHIDIRVDPDIDQEYVQIPPLLLQPYVENAIWHGLMHKPEGGTVLIDVTQPTDQCLHVEITDDGIGRTRAAEIKSKSAGKQKSFGMQVTADRIRMINQLYNTQTQAHIHDLVSPSGDPMGTRVVLEIPV
ncbi:MAG: hypothetical protein EAZ91_21675 [Cytophagales bacterium]|nr:MAG: hypothetical protein EAZ91_21675 [Cytophagales bacterium]